MIHDKNSYCERCGKWCLGMVWRRKFSFEEAFKLAKENSSKKEVEEGLILHYKKYLHKKGISVEKTFPIEW